MHAANYLVCSLDELSGVIRRSSPAYVVSILDPGAVFPDLSATPVQDHMQLQMHDVDIPDDGSLKGNPSHDHARSLLRFADQVSPSDLILFHCVAGRRRSAAAALIVDLSIRIRAGSPADNQTIQSCLDALLSVRAAADPNRALLQVADDILGLAGSLAKIQLPPRILDLGLDQ
mgnify:CR=1 FL=1